jgi:hypothetical protein
MGRASRVNVKRKEVEIARAINQALLRRQTGVREKSKNEDKTFLTEPTSLEMLINPLITRNSDNRSVIFHRAGANNVLKGITVSARAPDQRVDDHARVTGEISVTA